MTEGREDDGYFRVMVKGVPDHCPEAWRRRFEVEVLAGHAWLTQEEIDRGYFFARKGYSEIMMVPNGEKTWDDLPIWIPKEEISEEIP